MYSADPFVESKHCGHSDVRQSEPYIVIPSLFVPLIVVEKRIFNSKAPSLDLTF